MISESVILAILNGIPLAYLKIFDKTQNIV